MILESDIMNRSNNKNKYLIMVIFVIIIALVVGTLAWFSWQSKRSALVFTVGEIDKLQITLSPYEMDLRIAPIIPNVNNLEYGNDYVTITVTNNEDTSGNFNFLYNIIESDSELLGNTNMQYAIIKSIDGNSYMNVKTGNFSGMSVFNAFNIYSDTVPGNTIYYYKVYIYLNNKENNQSSLRGKKFHVNLIASID